MSNIDNLSININANANQAINNLDRLISRTKTLSQSMRTNANAINQFSGGVKRLSTAMQSMNNIKTSDFSQASRNIKKLAQAMQQMNTVNANDFTRLANNMNTFATSLGRIKVSSNAKEIGRLASNISKLGGKNVNNAISNLPLLTNELNNMLTSLANAPAVTNNVRRIVEAVARFSSGTTNYNASARGATSSTNQFSTATRALQKSLNLTGRAVNSVASGVKNTFVNSLKLMTSHMRKTQSTTTSLAQAIGKFYAAYFMVIRGARALGSSIKSAMDYVEVLNYFDASFGQVATKAVDNWKAMGYESAQAYYDSFAERAKVLTSQMSGFTITEEGMLKNTGEKTMGINPTQVMNYQSMYAQMASSMGVASEMSLKLSRALTEIGADLASVKNLEFNDVWQDMASGLVGMSRTLDKYGVNIRNVNMQQKLASLGIQGTVQSLNQNDKALLRTIILLDSTEYAWADLADTISQPANQLRLLSSNLSNLSRTIGNIFLPIVAKVLPYVNGFVIALERLGEKIVELLGFTGFDWGSAGGSNDGISDLLDEADSLADSFDNADESAKKLKKSVRDFDKLDVISSQDKDNGSGSGKTPIDTSALTAAFDDALERYQKRWNKGFKEMTNSAAEFADELEKAFSKAWKTDDGSDIGKAIADWLNKGIDWVNTHNNTFDKGLKKIVTIFGTSINGFTEKFKWNGLGKAIGSSIKSAIEAETKFFETVDWTNLGKGISSSLNGFIGSGVIEASLKKTATKLKSAIELAFGGIKSFSFVGLGRAIGQGINDFFDTMAETNKKTGKNGWEMLGASISDGFIGITDTFIVAFKKTDWKKVGQSLVDTISNINFFGMGWNFGTLVSSMASALYQTLVQPGTVDKLSKSIADGINGFIKAMNRVDEKTGKNGWQMAGGIVNALIQGLITAFNNVKWGDVIKGLAKGWNELDLSSQAFIITGIAFKWGGTGTITTLIANMIKKDATTGAGATALNGAGMAIGAQIAAGIGAAIAGWKFGNSLGKALFGDDKTFGTTGVYDMSPAEIVDYFTEYTREKIYDATHGGTGAGKVGQDYLKKTLKLDDDQLRKLWNEEGLSGFSDEDLKSIRLDNKGNAYSFNDVISSSDMARINKAYQKILSTKTTTPVKGYDLQYSVSDKAAEIILGDNETFNKAVNLAVTITGNDKVKTFFSDVWSKYVNKGVTLTAKGKKDESFTDTKKAYDGVKNKDATATAKGRKDKSFTETKSIYDLVKSKIAQLKTTGVESKSFATAESDYNGVKSKTANLTLTADQKAFNTVLTTVKSQFTDFFKPFKEIGTALGLKFTVPAHASGAYVAANKPQLAIIGDNKTEGEFVAPESKLKSAVQEAMLTGASVSTQEELTLMREQNTLLRQLVNKDTSISYKDVFNATRKGNEEFKLINGKSGLI